MKKLYFILLLIIATNIYSSSFNYYSNQKRINFKKIMDFAKLNMLVKECDESVLKRYPQAIIINTPKKQNRFFIITDHEKQTQTVVIRGTSNFKNVLTDANARLYKSDTLKIKVHLGFYRAYLEILDYVKPYIIKDYKLNLTGHSLGGALSSLLAIYYHLKGMKIENVVTFGQPKFTNFKGREKYRKILPIIRVINLHDVVPLVPPNRLFGYYHIGLGIILLKNNKYTIFDETEKEKPNVISLWNKLFSNQVSFEDHHMINYVYQLKKKLKYSKYIKYDQRNLECNKPKRLATFRY